MAVVLIVDDNTDLVEAWGNILAKKGNDYLTASNGQEGLDLLVKNPCIIFCDYDMEVMNGYEFSAKIKSEPKYERYRGIRIIGIGDFPEGKREYLSESLIKPISINQLQECILKYCI